VDASVSFKWYLKEEELADLALQIWDGFATALFQLPLRISLGTKSPALSPLHVGWREYHGKALSVRSPITQTVGLVEILILSGCCKGVPASLLISRLDSMMQSTLRSPIA